MNFKFFLSIFLFFLLLVSPLAYSQVTFTKVPLDKQLIGRDLLTNTGQIYIEGNVDSNGVNYQSIEIDIFRNNVFSTSVSQSLNFNTNTADFNFDIPIIAELANYTFMVYGNNAGVRTLEKEINEVVVGDAYIIQGQSNAEARQRSGDANIYQNDFVRVYANGTNNSSDLLNNNEWYLGQGNGSRNTNGNCGQWGLAFANAMVNNTNVPVAIFNGAQGGNEIDFFLAPDNYTSSQASNYGRLYYRLDQTELKDHVRGVLWSQGERDADPSAATTTTQYKNEFDDLKSSWMADYTNIEHIYIFQTKNGCDKPVENVMQIKEAQRQLAFEDPNITTIPTSAIPHYTDDCHFSLEGYEKFSDRLFRIVLRDLFEVTSLIDADAPMIVGAKMIDANTLEIETDAKTALETESMVENFVVEADDPTEITDITAMNNRILISLSNAIISNTANVSHIPPSDSENFITNSNNIEIISFYKYPIDVSFLSANQFGSIRELKLFPNPSKDKIKIDGLETSWLYRIFDVLGSKVMEGKINNDQAIDINELTKGIYLVKVNDRNSIKFIKQ